MPVGSEISHAFVCIGVVGVFCLFGAVFVTSAVMKLLIAHCLYCDITF